MYVTPIESDPVFHQKLNVSLTDEGTIDDTFEKTVANLKQILFLLVNAGGNGLKKASLGLLSERMAA